MSVSSGRATPVTLYFNIVDVMRQRNRYDCVHALATAVNIVFKRVPTRSHWDLSSMPLSTMLGAEKDLSITHDYVFLQM